MRSNKLLLTWVGPYRVERADVHSFSIKHLITGAVLDFHASRLNFYADSSLDVTEELLEHILSQGIVLGIEKLKNHRWNTAIGDFEIWVQCKEFEAIEDSYEPLVSLAKDVFILVNQYVAAADQELKAHWQRTTAAAKRNSSTRTDSSDRDGKADGQESPEVQASTTANAFNNKCSDTR